MFVQNPGTSRTRRRLLAAAAGIAAGAVLQGAGAAPRVNPPALLDNEPGGYRVLPAGSVFCGGAVPLPGYEIVHVLLRPWLPLADAWSFLEAYLKDAGRPVQALCGLELRTPAQLDLEGFRAFNLPYVEQLRKRDLVLGRYSAVCRTNVVPAADAPKAAMVYAFSYAAPLDTKATPQPARTFCISGTADLDARGRAVAEGDVSVAGMRKRLQHCVDTMTERLAELELEWADATHTDLSVAHDIDGLLGELLIPALGEAGRRGIRVHYARPPLLGAEVELECRGVRRELVASA